MKLTAKCKKCDETSQCQGQCQHPRATIHQGSPPCISLSGMGHQDGDTGAVMSAVAAWFAMRLALAEPIIWMEESERWEHQWTLDFLEDEYVCMGTTIEVNECFGWPVRRNRYDGDDDDDDDDDDDEGTSAFASTAHTWPP